MIIVLITAIIAIIMILIERIVPGRPWEQVSGWWFRAGVLNLIQVGGVFLAGLTWNKWLVGHSFLQSESLFGMIGGAIVGYLVITFVFYWWHRLRHEVNFLWRWFHQIHHSPQRLEIITAFYKHPFEIIINSLISSTILYILMGLSHEAASLAVLMTGVAELFYHWNIKTPYWLGFIVQRPESHCIHHQKNWHRHNYADLPFWDMIFGTFYNPKIFEATCGFDQNREMELEKMLVGIDVNKNVSLEDIKS